MALARGVLLSPRRGLTRSGRPGLRRLVSLAATALTVAAAVGWLLLLRPQSLGGPVAYVLVSGASMEPALHDGDLVVARPSEAYERGDVIVYRVPEGEVGAGALVIHRVTGGSAARGYVTKGDNRAREDLWRPRPGDVEGRLWLRLPGAGRALALLRTPLGLALVAGLLAFAYAGRLPAAGSQAGGSG